MKYMEANLLSALAFTVSLADINTVLSIVLVVSAIALNIKKFFKD